jgi:NAD(P)-dependent dehydrogenase (short-subunit alcohol dehydrogenase family)
MRAIVTGHSRGFGAAIAEELLERGHSVLGVSRTLNASLALRFPDTLEQAALDLAHLAGLARWIEAGILDGFLAGSDGVLLVNNAGMLQPVGRIETQPADTIAQAVALNVGAALMLASAFAAASPDARDRRIAHVSSGAARKPYAGWSIYGATKAALDQHARAVALDGTANLRICSVAPGVIDTDMQAEVRESSAEQFPLRDRFIEMKRTGTLDTPQHAARRFVDYVLAGDFGAEATVDLRR